MQAPHILFRLSLENIHIRQLIIFLSRMISCLFDWLVCEQCKHVAPPGSGEQVRWRPAHQRWQRQDKRRGPEKETSCHFCITRRCCVKTMPSSDVLFRLSSKILFAKIVSTSCFRSHREGLQALEKVTELTQADYWLWTYCDLAQFTHTTNSLC